MRAITNATSELTSYMRHFKKSENRAILYVNKNKKDKLVAQAQLVYQAPSLFRSMPQVVVTKDENGIQVHIVPKDGEIKLDERDVLLWKYSSSSGLDKIIRKVKSWR